MTSKQRTSSNSNHSQPLLELLLTSPATPPPPPHEETNTTPSSSGSKEISPPEKTAEPQQQLHKVIEKDNAEEKIVEEENIDDAEENDYEEEEEEEEDDGDEQFYQNYLQDEDDDDDDSFLEEPLEDLEPEGKGEGGEGDGIYKPLDEGEELRVQYEQQLKAFLDHVIPSLPMNQLEIFHDFMIQQQLQFHSLLLSQKVNQQFQKNIRKSMRHEIKRLLHPPATIPPSAASPLNGSRNNSNEQQQNQQTNQPTVRKNSNPADSLQQASILSSAVGLGNLRSSMILDTQILPAERHEFYLYAQEAVDCISKDYQAIDDFNVSMEITWRLIPFIILPLPPAAFSSKKGGGLDISKKNPEGPFLFSCYYNGDNEGNGRYRWQIDKYSHEYQSISTPTNLKLSPTKHQGISIMLGLSIEDCTQLFNWMFTNSFWIDA